MKYTKLSSHFSKEQLGTMNATIFSDLTQYPDGNGGGVTLFPWVMRKDI